MPDYADRSCLFVTSGDDSSAAKMGRDLALVVQKQFQAMGRQMRIREMRVAGLEAVYADAARATMLGQVCGTGRAAAEAVVGFRPLLT